MKLFMTMEIASKVCFWGPKFACEKQSQPRHLRGKMESSLKSFWMVGCLATIVAGGTTCVASCPISNETDPFAITAINLHREQTAPPPRPAHERVAWVDQGWLEFWRRHAVA